MKSLWESKLNRMVEILQAGAVEATPYEEIN